MRRAFILTSSTKGAAVHCLPALKESDKFECAGIILCRATQSGHRKKDVRRILRKIRKIGLAGAAVGIVMRRWHPTPDTDLESLARTLGIDVFEVSTVNSPECADIIKSLDAEIGFSLGNSYISSQIYDIPQKGMINLHMEILPDYQNAQSIIWPIYQMRAETGITFHKVSKQIDTGDILIQRRLPITFRSHLKDTVVETKRRAFQTLPEVFSALLHDFDTLYETAKPQGNGQHFTTPTLRQFLKMVSNNHRLFRTIGDQASARKF